jgi:hypothetical protein
MSRLVEDVLATARREAEGFDDAAVDLAEVAQPGRRVQERALRPAGCRTVARPAS